MNNQDVKKEKQRRKKNIVQCRKKWIVLCGRGGVGGLDISHYEGDSAL